MLGLGVGGGVGEGPRQAPAPGQAPTPTPGQAPTPRTPRKGPVSLANELSQRALTLTGPQPPHAQPGSRAATPARAAPLRRRNST